MVLLDTLKELEIRLHDPVVRSNAERMAQLLHASFREFGRSGAVYTRDEILAQLSRGAAMQQPTIWSQDFALELLSDNFALLTYRSAYVDEKQELQHHTNRISLWQRFESCWKIRFHQGTATQPFAKRPT